MTKDERENFIIELGQNVLREIIKNAVKMPDDWNGIELRQYMADKFRDCCISGTMDRARKRKYNNTIITTTL